MFFIQENLAKTLSQILIYRPHNQLLQAMKIIIKLRTFAREQILFLVGHYLN